MATEDIPTGTERQTSDRSASSFSPANYLSLIIGLIAVVCLSVGLVLSYASESLSASQTWFLIGFLTVFAVFGVTIVTWLVMRHARQMAVAEFDGSLEWRTTSPDKQKRRLNVEVRELGRILGVEPNQLADLRAAYIVAEDLALRRVQNESGIPLKRKVSIGTADFDAVLVERDLVICVSILFLVRPEISEEKVARLLREAAIARNIVGEVREGSRIRLLLLLVTQLDDEDEARLRSSVVDYFKSTPVDVDIRWMDFQKLQKLYSDE